MSHALELARRRALVTGGTKGIGESRCARPREPQSAFGPHINCRRLGCRSGLAGRDEVHSAAIKGAAFGAPRLLSAARAAAAGEAGWRQSFDRLRRRRAGG